MYSCGDVDTLHLPQDMGAYMGAQTLGSHQLNPTSQELFEKERQIHEIVKGVPVGRKLNEYIHVTRSAVLPGDQRAEQTEPFDAEGRQVLLGALKALNHLRLARNRFVHLADTLLHESASFNSTSLARITVHPVSRYFAYAAAYLSEITLALFAVDSVIRHSGTPGAYAEGTVGMSPEGARPGKGSQSGSCRTRWRSGPGGVCRLECGRLRGLGSRSRADTYGLSTWMYSRRSNGGRASVREMCDVVRREPGHGCDFFDRLAAFQQPAGDGKALRGAALCSSLAESL